MLAEVVVIIAAETESAADQGGRSGRLAGTRGPLDSEWPSGRTWWRL